MNPLRKKPGKKTKKRQETGYTQRREKEGQQDKLID